MIRNNNFTWALLLGSLILGSCGSDPQPQPQVQIKQGFAQFTMDNVVWEGPATISGSNGTLTANRYNNAEILTIQFPNLSTGTYNLTNSPMPFISLQNATGLYNSYVCSPAGGRITVTEFTGSTMSGTFSAKICTSSGQTKDIVNGTFTNITIGQ